MSMHGPQQNITIKQNLSLPGRLSPYLDATKAIYNRVVAFYVEVLMAHQDVLTLSGKDQLTALEKLTHATRDNPSPAMPLSPIADRFPAMMRRAAIHMALGDASSYLTRLGQWTARKEAYAASLARRTRTGGRPFTERPPVPTREYNYSPTFYKGQWSERGPDSIVLSLYTGQGETWVRVKATVSGHAFPADLDVEMGSPSLVKTRKGWRLHTPVTIPVTSPGSIVKQFDQHKENPHDLRLCAVDLVRRRKLSETSGRPMTPSQGILSPCPHVKGSLTPATSVVSNEPDGMQVTQAPLTGSLHWSCARGSLDGPTQVNCPHKAPSWRKGAIRLMHPDQKVLWVAAQQRSLCGDRTHSHRSIGRVHPGRISTLGTTISPMGSPAGNRSKPTARRAELPRGYRMLEQANAWGNAQDRGSRFAPRRKAADFQQATTIAPL